MILMMVLKNYFSVLIELTMTMAVAEAAYERASDDGR